MWAAGYDADVNLTDEDNEYPFAGYKDILGLIYAEIMAAGPCDVLDVGLGTGVLTTKLYDADNRIVGVDFSEKMLEIAGGKMPGAELICHDFTKGLPDKLAGQKFDFIVSTYALHHLSDEEKLRFIADALEHLNPTGTIIIGDTAFESAEAQDKCRVDWGDDWDEDEFYIVYPEFAKLMDDGCKTDYRQISHCGGILTVRHVS